jgi:hypothetical protein
MLKLIFYVVVGVLALSFFGISLRELIQDPQTQDNFSFIIDLVRNGWGFLTGWVEGLGEMFRGER